MSNIANNRTDVPLQGFEKIEVGTRILTGVLVSQSGFLGAVELGWSPVVSSS